MNFRTIGLGLATAVAVTIGATLAKPSAQAATLAPGSFNLIGKSSLTDTGTFDASDGFTINFNSFNVGFGDDVLANLKIGVGGATVQSLTVNGALEVVSSTNAFVSNIFLDNNLNGFVDAGEALFLDLDPVKFTALSGITQNQYSLAAAFSGVLRDANNNVIAIGSLGASGFSVRNTQASIGGVTAVPTPALLPAALGMGVAALRKKRKQEADADLASDPVEA